MDRDIMQKYFFLSVLLIVSALIFFIFLPFLEVIVLSIIFAVTLDPIYSRIQQNLGGRKGVAAFVTIILFAFVIILPASFLTIRLINESRDVYIQLINYDQINYIQTLSTTIEVPIQKFYSEFQIDLGAYISLGADWLLNHFSTIISKFISIIVGIILLFISLFFLLKDGHKFKKTLIRLSPLSDEHDEQIFGKMKDAIRTTIKSVLLVALIQGILAGVGMFIFSVPNATLWGTVSAVASLVPGLGTAIVFIPAVLYMLIIGNTPFAIGLLLWGVLVVGLVDNFLSPYLYSRGLEIHSLIMLFGVLGGLIVFGPIGFIFGPIIISLFFALIDIYQEIILKNKSL